MHVRNPFPSTRAAGPLTHLGLVSAAVLLALLPASAQQKRSTLSSPTAAAAAASVDPKNDTIKKVSQLVDGMGYTVKSSGADYLVIEANNLLVALEPAGDGSSIYGSIYYTVPKEKQGGIPYPQMLAYNGHAADYFGTSQLDDGSMSVSLMDHIPMANITPRALKDMVDLVTNDAHKQSELLDPGNWKSALPEFSTK